MIVRSKRRLAATRAAEQRDDLAALDAQVHVLEERLVVADARSRHSSSTSLMSAPGAVPTVANTASTRMMKKMLTTTVRVVALPDAARIAIRAHAEVAARQPDDPREQDALDEAVREVADRHALGDALPVRGHRHVERERRHEHAADACR